VTEQQQFDARPKAAGRKKHEQQLPDSGQRAAVVDHESDR